MMSEEHAWPSGWHTEVVQKSVSAIPTDLTYLTELPTFQEGMELREEMEKSGSNSYENSIQKTKQPVTAQKYDSLPYFKITAYFCLPERKIRHSTEL